MFFIHYEIKTRTWKSIIRRKTDYHTNNVLIAKTYFHYVETLSVEQQKYSGYETTITNQYFGLNKIVIRVSVIISELKLSILLAIFKQLLLISI